MPVWNIPAPAERDEELTILQKAAKYYHQTPEMKYVFIENHQADSSIKAMCPQ